MKPLGLVRRMDPLGRIVIPVELRKSLKLDPGTPVEIFGTEDGIFLQPAEHKESPGDVLRSSIDKRY